jgi:dephospho-CoA kinase
MAKIIFGLVGTLASGKGAVKKRLVEKYKAEDCRFSTVLRDVLKRIDVPTTRENLQNISTSLRQLFGEDLLAKAIAKDASTLNADIVVIDGIRRMSDIGHLLSLSNFILVAIDANPEIRYKRLVERNENAGDDKKTYEEFQADQNVEADKMIPEVIKVAKEKINNDGSLEELYKQIDGIVLKYSK